MLVFTLCTAIDSAPGHDNDMKPVSLEPLGAEKVQVEKICP